MTWQTRTLAVYIAATVPVEKEGDVNPLLESALKLGEPGDEKETANEQPKPIDNGIGSYERFMATFGSPARWAGR